MKKTATAPANIAFVKYWGLKNSELRIPTNGSVSMNLSNLKVTTTVEFDAQFPTDRVIVNGKTDAIVEKRVIKHLDLIRKEANTQKKAMVVSSSNFPMATGLASSAAAFASLTMAASSAAGLNMSAKELTRLARRGSGSACRSIPDGFVEWVAGETDETSFARSIFPPLWWDIVDVVVIVSTDKKKVSSTQGHLCVLTSPFFKARLAHINTKLQDVKRAIEKKDFASFGTMIEQEALELQAITMTSNPPVVYMIPETIAIMQLVHQLREKGLPVFFTLDAGPNIHLLVEVKNEEALMGELKKEPSIKKLIVNHPSVGARLINGESGI